MNSPLAKLVSRVLLKFASLSSRLSSRIVPGNAADINALQYTRCIPWFKDNGDRTLRLNYDLTENSVVFDLGGYEGQWAADIFIKYACRIFIFEPYPVYAQNIRDRFSPNPKVNVFQYGLSDSDKKLHLQILSDSSSVYKNGKDSVEVVLRKSSDFFAEQDVNSIDLLKINIEGGEFDLLDHLIETGFVRNIKNIQVQFHDFVPEAASRMKKIQAELSKTHFTTYQYEFVWENWRLK